ncbi:hypothetical protein [Planctomyces sp. SH-PL14]|uniref:hypothetical protein n=1 Tax=Planctomyces sp. SH-PL14 TaxID=1632864 RepID=UPI00078B6F8D|nr:hypothetical protein [Planctomyces sp. SH-PL14]AMV20439.1 hypothetical protein VT03_21250 [Planctomyces sp. SH-PL14]
MAAKVEFEFDNCTHQSDAPRSWIEVTENDEGLFGMTLDVFVNGRKENEPPELHVQCVRDQWGTWIAFQGSGGVAQEDETVSFIDALIAGLTELKKATDFGTKAPERREVE